jgi:ADP-ribose pyrophosphatase YjhB (NUDIX family)
MKFCSSCAHPVAIEIPADDHLPRHVCSKCGAIFYQNPKLVVCTIPVWEQDGETKVLLCRRAIEPRYGLWTLPGGFMENNETTTHAALRETSEEAGANIEVISLFSLINLPSLHQVHLFYRSRLINLEFNPGPESLEVRMFSEAEIPWGEIAFTSVKHALEVFFDDVAKVKRGGTFGFHSHDIMFAGYPSA